MLLLHTIEQEHRVATKPWEDLSSVLFIYSLPLPLAKSTGRACVCYNPGMEQEGLPQTLLRENFPRKLGLVFLTLDDSSCHHLFFAFKVN